QSGSPAYSTEASVLRCQRVGKMDPAIGDSRRALAAPILWSRFDCEREIGRPGAGASSAKADIVGCACATPICLFESLWWARRRPGGLAPPTWPAFRGARRAGV